MSSAEPGARCARHPDVDASEVCARCGDFLCAACTLVTSEGRPCCARCQPLAGEPFPWERRGELGLGRAFLETFTGTIVRTRELFARGFRDRSVVPALAFGAAIETPIAIARAALYQAFPAPEAGMLLPLDRIEIGRAIGAPILFALETALVAAFWWVGLMFVGEGKRSFADVLRAMAYVRGALAPLGLTAIALAHLDSDVRVIAGLSLALVSLLMQTRAIGALTGASAWRVIAAAAVMVLALSAILCGVGIAAALIFYGLRP